MGNSLCALDPWSEVLGEEAESLIKSVFEFGAVGGARLSRGSASAGEVWTSSDRLSISAHLFKVKQKSI